MVQRADASGAVRYGVAAALCVIALGVGCESAEPPAPPSIASSASTGSGTADATSRDSDRSSDERDADTEEDGGKTSASSDNQGYNRDIIDVLYQGSGNDAEKSAFLDCAYSSVLFFDRFPSGGGTGDCTKEKLAELECTNAGVKAVLTDTQKTQYASQMSGDYAGYTLDQCVDCPPDGSSDVCSKTDASGTKTKQTGTKLFLVKNDGGTIRGKAIVIPERPGK
jgi:hypothetical protein